MHAALKTLAPKIKELTTAEGYSHLGKSERQKAMELIATYSNSRKGRLKFMLSVENYTPIVLTLIVFTLLAYQKEIDNPKCENPSKCALEIANSAFKTAEDPMVWVVSFDSYQLTAISAYILTMIRIGLFWDHGKEKDFWRNMEHYKKNFSQPSKKREQIIKYRYLGLPLAINDLETNKVINQIKIINTYSILNDRNISISLKIIIMNAEDVLCKVRENYIKNPSKSEISHKSYDILFLAAYMLNNGCPIDEINKNLSDHNHIWNVELSDNLLHGVHGSDFKNNPHFVRAMTLYLISKIPEKLEEPEPTPNNTESTDEEEEKDDESNENICLMINEAQNYRQNYQAQMQSLFKDLKNKSVQQILQKHQSNDLPHTENASNTTTPQQPDEGPLAYFCRRLGEPQTQKANANMESFFKAKIAEQHCRESEQSTATTPAPAGPTNIEEV